MRAIIYIRVSTKEQVEGNSLELQREACLRYASERSLLVEEIFVEEGESAKIADRTQLLRLLERCRANKGQIQALIVWKVDRFARNASDHFHIKALLTRNGVSIHSVTEPIDDSHMGRMMETILAGWAEFDNAVRAERATEGMRKKLEQGIWPWRPPYGYLPAGSKSRGEKKTEPDKPDPQSFELVQRVRREFLKGIHSVASITRFAEHIGLRASFGSRLQPQSIERILRNPFYAGVLVNPWTKEEVSGLHLAMLSREEHTKTLLILKGRSLNAAPRTRNHPDFPLRKFVRCGRDGYSFTGSWSSGRSRKYAYYRCTNRGCDVYCHSVSKAALENQFLAFLGSVTPKKAYLELFRAVVIDVWRKKYREYNADAERYERRLAQLKREKMEFITGKGKLLADEEFLTVKAQYDEEIAITQVSLNESRIEEWDLEGAVAYATKFVTQLPRLWFDLPLEQQQRFQQLVFPRGVSYAPEHGFGTAELGPIYEINRRSGSRETQLVPQVMTSWNRLVEHLKAWQAVRSTYPDSHTSILAALESAA